ncbi:MAG: sigma-70 family RNA polymerase sigma factor [Candidatus Azobacteroides sp.]|nr:sigma-70 family RNA polymerase sigma factor [Candidatus Azobacteroides sp.]
MNELELVTACQENDNTARKMLYERYAEQMMGICFRYMAEQETSYDLLHDGFIKVFERIHLFEYRGEGSLRAWMSRLFVNISLEFLRRRETDRTAFSPDAWKEAEIIESEEELTLIPDHVLMDFIAGLPDGYRSVFNLYTFEELSHKEIGLKLGITESASRSQLSRARSILTKKVKDYIKVNG